MNISPINCYNQNFQAKFKLSEANKKLLGQTATVAAGASTIFYGSESLQMMDLGDESLNSMVETLPDKLVKSHRDVLGSGTACQATTVPGALWSLGSSLIFDGTNPDDDGKILFT